MNRRYWIQSILALFGTFLLKPKKTFSNESKFEKVLCSDKCISNINGSIYHEIQVGLWTLVMNPSFPIYTDKGWIAAKDVKVNCLIDLQEYRLRNRLLKTNAMLKVLHIEHREKDHYNDYFIIVSEKSVDYFLPNNHLYTGIAAERKYRWVKAKDIKVGDFIHPQHTMFRKESISSWEFLKKKLAARKSA